MRRSKILITGVTGKTGNVVARQLLQEHWPVRAVVRHENIRSKELRRLGAEGVGTGIFDAEQVAQPLRGVQRACYVTLSRLGIDQAAAAFAAAAEQDRLETMVHDIERVGDAVRAMKLGNSPLGARLIAS